jgi:flavin-dependent dehydrogenase
VCRARLTVIADGAGSSLRRRLGLDGPLPGRIRTGIRTHFRLATGHLQPALVEVYLGRGYELYVTPLPEGEVLVAALAEAGAASTGADRCIARWIGEQPDLARLLVGAARVSPYLGRSPLARSSLAGFAAGAVLLGDAAGYLDPITGGGISQALLTAELLAQQMPGILSGGDAALATFDSDRRGLLRDYVLLTRLVLGLSRRPAVAKASIHVMRALPPLFSHMVGVAGGVSALLPGRADSHSAHGEPVEP